jgi:hypothetical protein
VSPSLIEHLTGTRREDFVERPMGGLWSLAAWQSFLTACPKLDFTAPASG